ncbi:unnamed protein product, partial [Staurois parvus]
MISVHVPLRNAAYWLSSPHTLSADHNRAYVISSLLRSVIRSVPGTQRATVHWAPTGAPISVTDHRCPDYQCSPIGAAYQCPSVPPISASSSMPISVTSSVQPHQCTSMEKN